MANAAASQQDAGEQKIDARRAIGVWWRRMVADQTLQKVSSLIRVRQYELASLIAEAKSMNLEPAELDGRLARAKRLVDEPLPTDRALANELLDKLDTVLPLVADDERLRLMLES